MIKERMWPYRGSVQRVIDVRVPCTVRCGVLGTRGLASTCAVGEIDDFATSLSESTSFVWNRNSSDEGRKEGDGGEIKSGELHVER